MRKVCCVKTYKVWWDLKSSIDTGFLLSRDNKLFKHSLLGRPLISGYPFCNPYVQQSDPFTKYFQFGWIMKMGLNVVHKDYKTGNIFSKSFSILLRGSRIFSKFWRNFCKKEKLLHFMFFWQYVSAISQLFGFWIEFGYLYFDINTGSPDICIESSLKMISKITWKP